MALSEQLTAGDSIDFTLSYADYPATAGWSLVYKLIPRTGATVISLTSAASGADHRFTAAPATTATWAAAPYGYTLYATKTGARATLAAGQLVIAPDPAVVTTFDSRSLAQKALDDAKTALATYTASNANVTEYSIAGRSMKFKSSGDIVALIDYWQGQVVREQRKAAIAAGLGNPSRIGVRFNRV